MRIFRPLLAWLCVASLVLGNLFAADKTVANLRPIFTGTNLAGWRVPDPNPFWKAVDGVLIGENDEKLQGHVLHTTQSYSNFVLELEVRWSGAIDSGVMLREPELQVQFGISRSLKKDMTGAFYLAKHPLNPQVGYPDAGHTQGIEKLFKAGEWNKFRIEAKGDTFTVWLNGGQISQYTDPRYAGGAPLGLQIHPGLKMKVEFRQIRAVALE